MSSLRLPTAWLGVLLLGPTAHAADADEPDPPIRHHLDLSLGYADLAIRDDAASALRYHAPNAVGALAYDGAWRAARWRVELGAGGGPIVAAEHPDRAVVFASTGDDGGVDEVVVPMRGTQLSAQVSAGAQARVTPAGRCELRVGGRVGWDLSMPSGFTTPGLYSLVGLQPTIGGHCHLPRLHEIEANVGQTLIGAMTRMPYHQTVSLPETGQIPGLFRQGTGFRSPADLIAVRADVAWRVRVRGNVGVGVAYRFTWLADDTPRPLRVAQHALSFTLRTYPGGL